MAFCALVVTLAAPAAASASTFVVSSPGAGGSDSSCAPCVTIEGAIIKAGSHAGADTIQLGVGVYTMQVLLEPSNPVTLVGQGRFATVISAYNHEAVSADGAHVVRGVTLRAYDSTVATIGNGTLLDDTQLQGIVNTPGLSVAGVAATGHGTATVRNTEIIMPHLSTPNSSYGITSMQDGSLNVQHAIVQADTGMAMSAGATWIVGGSTFNSFSSALNDDRGADVRIYDTELNHIGTAPVYQVSQYTGAGETGSLLLDGVVLDGLGTGSSDAGVGAGASGGGVETLVVVNSVFHDFTTDVGISEDALSTTDSEITRSAVNPMRVSIEGSAVSPLGLGNINTGAAGFSFGFVNASAHEYRLTAASPLRDSGAPGPLASARPKFDIRGEARLRDGNGDGVARIDIGAWERQSAPRVVAAPAVTGTAKVGSNVACPSSWSTGSGASFTWRWYRSGHTAPIAQATGSKYVVRPGDAGRYLRCKVVATTSDEQRSALSPWRKIA